MKRHASLIPLTHDHHYALAQVRKLKSAARRTDDDRRSAAKLFLEFFHADTIQHFREEEELVFPLAVEAAEVRGTLERVMMHHLHIHALVHQLHMESEEGDPTSETLARLAATLERHVRFEEKVVFPMIETIVGGSSLDAISLRARVRAAV
jgi:iron-sulfur cluster repair protein YtfE (RIC family)